MTEPRSPVDDAQPPAMPPEHPVDDTLSTAAPPELPVDDAQPPAAPPEQLVDDAQLPATLPEHPGDDALSTEAPPWGHAVDAQPPVVSPEAPVAPPPIVSLERVVAHDEAGPRGRPRGRLHHTQMALGPGRHAILGSPEDGTLALAQLITGHRRPVSGRVRVEGHDPARHAPTRARLGALLPEPDTWATRSVEAFVEMARRARGEASGSAATILEPFGLGRLLPRRPGSLSFAEARAVELALALSTPSPRLLVLFEPFADIALPADVTRAHLRALGSEGVCVALITSSRADALAEAEQIHVLHRGVMLPPVPTGRGGELVVQVEEPPHGEAGPPGIRTLAAALLDAPSIQALAWERAETSAPSGAPASPQPGPAVRPPHATLRVRSPDLEAASLAILEAASRTGVTLASIHAAPLKLGESRRRHPPQHGGGR
ncbi:ATP-binding cassette domain-containing protein [Chondromyces crocatus]|uniref:ABC transporter domain-containing protein n=1 Tax=Chondromyces crocatus TaxID=52 RepID=A0A0K1ELX3_CHOCO|nr:ATP-binding cassette domain-containing protein [Chondromyces crocatus]AKT41900.1 uncharacterized protein CMC5_061220 [Chondromyces crocatus]